MNTIGERLAYTRKSLELSQQEFSKLLGISQGALSGMEKNSRGIPMEVIIKLLNYSKSDNRISCEWILTGDEGYISAHYSDLKNEDEIELLNNYRLLDSRGKHKLHTVIYEELDRMDAAPPSSAEKVS